MSSVITQAVILAGGMGTRLKPFTEEHPKPMYRFNERPFIDYLIRQVKSFGIQRVMLLLGYKPHEIIEYLGDGKKYGLEIDYSITPIEYDTGNRLYEVRKQLSDRFLLMYCDNYCPIDFEKLVDDAKKNNSDIQITAYANKDGYTDSNLKIGKDGKILIYDKKRETKGLEGVDIGYAIVKKSMVDLLSKNGFPSNFEKEIYPQCVARGRMYATVTEHRYYSIGSWRRIELTREFFCNKKTVFLDRDGTLNEKPPKACYVNSPEDFKWINEAKEAIGILKNRGYRIILITNQPGIARGNLTEHTLQLIHEKMQNELEDSTGYKIDDIYYCPHNWDDGCDCRKPKPGMFYQAQKKYSLNLRQCVMSGDDLRDMEAGRAAGCICYQVTNDMSLMDIVQVLAESTDDYYTREQ